MKRYFLEQQKNRIRLGLVCAAVLALLATALVVGRSSRSALALANAPEPSFQVPPKPWTALGSTGAVDEASLSTFAFGTADIAFKAGAAGTIVVARYNVTNTFDNNANPNKPGWTTLEMGSHAPLNTIIEAKLFQVKACGQDPVLLCTARNRSMDNPCAKCTIQGTVDFTSQLYYVEVTMNRTSPNNPSPRMFTLRLF